MAIYFPQIFHVELRFHIIFEFVQQIIIAGCNGYAIYPYGVNDSILSCLFAIYTVITLIYLKAILL